MASSLKALFDIMPQVGRVEWIGIRPEKRSDLKVVQEVQVDVATGIEGDHYSKANGKRMITLIQAEHIAAVANILQKDSIAPGLLRRNIVVSGVNLLALKDRTFQVGSVVLKTTGNCHPCSRMETNLGAGGYNAMRGHGGITTTVIKGGTIALGDEVFLLLEEATA